MPRLDAITIKGFKSIRALENFALRRRNILIGGNGAGKSNFMDFFRLLRAMCGFSLPGLPVSGLKNYVQLNGGSEALLHCGSKRTPSVHFSLSLNDHKYTVDLHPTVEENFLLSYAQFLPEDQENSSCHASETLASPSLNAVPFSELYQAIASWNIYHFHDTSHLSPMRRSADMADTAYLRPDGENLAPFLRALSKNEPRSYRRIVRAIRLVAPFFEDFLFTAPLEDKVRLDWKQKNSDYPMKPYHFSDGTLRYIALATALLQPQPPSLILIDEPELGLHPQALPLLAEMVKAVPETTQIILATQSAALVDYFAPEDVVVVNRREGASVFERLDPEACERWLQDYSLGTLWRKNVIDGGPRHE